YEGQKAVPITTSELRSVYRNWPEFRGKVLFYRNFICVRAPWETNRAWDRYGLARLNKYLCKLQDARQDNRAMAKANERELNRCVEAAGRLQEANLYHDAVAVVKHATSLLTGLAPPVDGVAPDVGATGKTLAQHVRDVLDKYDAQDGRF